MEQVKGWERPGPSSGSIPKVFAPLSRDTTRISLRFPHFHNTYKYNYKRVSNSFKQERAHFVEMIGGE